LTASLFPVKNPETLSDLVARPQSLRYVFFVVPVASFNSVKNPSAKLFAMSAETVVPDLGKVPEKEDSMVHWPSTLLLEMVVMGVFALSVNVKTQIEIIPITAAAIFEAVDILNTVEGLNSSWRGTLSRLRNLTSDIYYSILSLLW
jgi:hypothetical protein